jgi:hypothetical protein
METDVIHQNGAAGGGIDIVDELRKTRRIETTWLHGVADYAAKVTDCQ